MDSEASKSTRNPPTSRKSAAVLLLLSALSAISVLRPELLPNLLPQHTPTLQRQCLPLALLAVLTTMNALRHSESWPSALPLWQPIATGLGLFAAYPLLLSTGSGTDGYTRTILFTLIPIFCLIVEAAIAASSTASALQDRLALPASLAGIFGALCVFPVQLPTSLASAASFCATVFTAVLIAAAICLAVRTGSYSAPNSFAAIAAATATLALAATSLFTSQPIWTWRPALPELVWTVAIELPQVAIFFWLTRRTYATSIATRYLLTPLIAVLAGAALLQQPLTLRTSLGLIIMAASGLWLLLRPRTDEDSNPSTLSLH